MYNLSIIIPFHEKYKELEFALPYNYKEYKKALEVILVIDHKIEFKKLAFIKNYDINFKFLENKVNHPWRNPAVSINKGIREAKGEYIMIFSPESILFNNVVDNLYKNCNEKCYTYGNVSFMTHNFFEKNNYNTLKNIFKKENKSFTYKEILTNNFDTNINIKKDIKLVSYSKLLDDKKIKKIIEYPDLIRGVKKNNYPRLLNIVDECKSFEKHINYPRLLDFIIKNDLNYKNINYPKLINFIRDYEEYNFINYPRY